MPSKNSSARIRENIPFFKHLIQTMLATLGAITAMATRQTIALELEG